MTTPIHSDYKGRLAHAVRHLHDGLKSEWGLEYVPPTVETFVERVTEILADATEAINAVSAAEPSTAK